MSTNEIPQDSLDSQASRVPMRGIAMILLAVAIALLAWGVYAMTNADKQASPVVTKETSEVAAPAAGTPASTPTPAAPTPAATPTSAPGPAAAPAEAQPSGQGASGQGASASNVDPSAVKIHALNNSTVQGLANKVADNLRREGFTQVDSGNFPEEILPHSVAFYTPGVAAEEQAAQLIAQRLNIKTEPRNAVVKDVPAGVVVVITEELNR